MKFHYTLLSIGIFQFIRSVSSADSVGGCSPTPVDKGLYAEYIEVAENEWTVGDSASLESGLAVVSQREAEYSWSGVTEQDFWIYPGTNVLYGHDVTTDHFGLRLTGYLYAETTGDYTISITFADDAASLSIGAGVAMECCGSSQFPTAVTEYAHWYAEGESTSVAKTVHLTAGVYYPIKVVFMNVVSGAHFNMSVTYPDGTNHTTDIDWYSSTNNSTSCPYSTTTTNIWTGSDTEYFTVTGSDGDVT
ncbi:hypothetical protein CANTEDRAFT_112050, partial [Yamadazyma tenuis ATCC 10573]